MPRKLMENTEKKGVVPHLSQSAQRFKREGNKKPKGRVIAAHKSPLKIKRVACNKLPPKSRARLHCELTPGKYPVVAHKGAQFRLKRQGVGLVPLPEVGARTCMLCSTPSSVAHSAFECPAHSQPRKEAREALDRACSGLGLGDDHFYYPLLIVNLLIYSIKMICTGRRRPPMVVLVRWPKASSILLPKGRRCPSSPQKEKTSFSQAVSAWKNFYEGASWVACHTPDT